jgi:hypothetical protein
MHQALRLLFGELERPFSFLAERISPEVDKLSRRGSPLAARPEGDPSKTFGAL